MWLTSFYLIASDFVSLSSLASNQTLLGFWLAAQSCRDLCGFGLSFWSGVILYIGQVCFYHHFGFSFNEIKICCVIPRFTFCVLWATSRPNQVLRLVDWMSSLLNYFFLICLTCSNLVISILLFSTSFYVWLWIIFKILFNLNLSFPFELQS